VIALLAATLIIRGLAPTMLGCPESGPATSPMQIHAIIPRAAREDSTYAMPGSAFSISFFNVPLDTFTVRIWASNAAGPGCETVKLYESYIVTDVTPLPRTTIQWYDIQGRKVGRRSRGAVYFFRRTVPG
jgi:hypothetical protein